MLSSNRGPRRGAQRRMAPLSSSQWCVRLPVLVQGTRPCSIREPLMHTPGAFSWGSRVQPAGLRVAIPRARF